MYRYFITTTMDIINKQVTQLTNHCKLRNITITSITNNFTRLK